MRKTSLILLFVFLISFTIAASVGGRKNRLSRYSYFLPRSNNIIALCFKEKYKNFSIKVWANDDGRLLKEIPIESYENSDFNFCVSHDDSSIAVFSSFLSKTYKKKYKLRKYLLTEDKWAWEREWYSDSPYLDITFNEDNTRLIGISYDETIVVDARTGKFISESDEIGDIFGDDNGEPYTCLSRYGKYFVFWKNYPSPETYSIQAELGTCCLTNTLDILGDILFSIFVWWWQPKFHNYINMWDVEADTLIHQVEIPKREIIGTPAITWDEKKCLLGTIADSFYVYSLNENKLVKTMEIDTLTESGMREKNDWCSFRIISPDEMIFISGNYKYFTVRDFSSGNLIDEIKGESSRIVFSPDNKFIAYENEGRLTLCDAKTFEVIWWVYTYPEDTELDE